jgi:hypothetical protein
MTTELTTVTRNPSWSSTDSCGFVEATNAHEATRRLAQAMRADITGNRATRAMSPGMRNEGGDDR